MLKLEEVRLTAYPETASLPEGFNFVSEKKGKTKPKPWPWNWFGRPDTEKHAIFHRLALANQDPANPGVTVDELKASVPEADRPTVDEIVAMFRSGGPRHAGWDLIEGPGAKLAIVYRDPRVQYVAENQIEGNFADVAVAPTPSYVTKIPNQLEELRNPKPKPEKAPRERKPKADGSTPTAPANAAPEGGYLKAFNDLGVAAKVDGGGTITVEAAIDQFVDPNAAFTPKDAKEGDEPKNVKAELLALLDKVGLEHGGLVDFIANRQREGSIKAGLYRIFKDAAVAYNGAKTASAA